jgi:hypothetical protein
MFHIVNQAFPGGLGFMAHFANGRELENVPADQVADGTNEFILTGCLTFVS